MYYELCGMLSKCLVPKMLYYYVAFFLFCLHYVNIRFMNVCMQFFMYYNPGFIKHGQIPIET